MEGLLQQSKREQEVTHCLSNVSMSSVRVSHITLPRHRGGWGVQPPHTPTRKRTGNGKPALMKPTVIQNPDLFFLGSFWLCNLIFRLLFRKPGSYQLKRDSYSLKNIEAACIYLASFLNKLLWWLFPHRIEKKNLKLKDWNWFLTEVLRGHWEYKYHRVMKWVLGATWLGQPL